MPNYTSKRRKPDHLIVENDESPYRVFTRDDLLEQLIKENLIQENGILSFADQYLELPDPPKGTPCSSSIRAGIPALRLQFQELLVRVRYPCGYLVDEVESGLQELKQVIENIPCREGMPILEAEDTLIREHSIAIPFPDPRPDPNSNYHLSYDQPDNINVVGSHARKTGLPAEEMVVIDLAVTMPSHIFEKKDYLNYRYYYKKAYYLACIAAGIQNSSKFKSTLTFALQNDNHLQPILLINACAEDANYLSKSKCQVRVILAAAEDLFPKVKTLPDRSCIRLKDQGKSPLDCINSATPFYNATLRSECSTLPYLKLLDQSSKGLVAFRDTCILGGIWLQQRGLTTGLANGGFGQFEWACIVALLLQGGGSEGKPFLSKSHESYLLMKATLKFIAVTDLILHPLIVGSGNAKFMNQNGPVLFDSERGMNILFKMTKWSYYMLRYEASLTIQALNDPKPHADSFYYSFIAKTDNPFHKFDELLSLSIPSTSILASQEFGPVNQFNQLNQEIYDTLMKGLGDRVKLIYLKHSKPTPWHLASSRSIDESCRNIVIGVLLDAERSRRSIDYGPSAEDKTAAIAFRGFWGPKAELRRFKDGSILESLIWSKTDSNNSILDQIILFVLQRHFTQKITDGMTSQGAAFRRLLNQNLISSNPTPLFHSTEIAFKNLEKSIRGIEGLPLQIRQISTSSSTIRFASRNAQILSLGTHNVRPEHIYVQFEGSSRWPDDLLAIQRTKIAFLLKIGDLMERSTTGLTTRLGLENNTHRLLNQAFLDVFYPGRVIFRLRIHHERELDILEQSLKDRANDLRSKKEKALAVAVYKRDFILGPLHTQAMRTLSTRFPFLLDSMRLMKIWRDSHLLSAHISDEIIEHLTIRTFVQPYPWPVPASIMSGFLRTLFFVSRWDWQFEPLIVDFNHDMTSKDIEGIYLRFDAWRRADPSMNRVVMFSASKLDPEGIIWTQQRPCKVVAARFSSLAKAACNHIVCQGLNLQVDELFITSITDYDFIIHLSPELSSSKTDRDLKQPTFKNFLITSGECPSPKTSNILQAFLEEVSIFYEKCILFFYNVTNISLIAGLWTSQVGSRDWKVSTTSSTMPMQHMGDTDAKATINKAAILHDIARLGGNLVSRIEVKR